MTGRNAHNKNGRAGHRALISVLLYILCLFAGLTAIYLVQFQLQSSLKDNVTRAASQLADGKELESGYTYMHINVYLYEDGEISFLAGHFSRDYGDYEEYVKYISKYAWFAEDEDVHYRVIPTMPGFLFIAISAAPVSDGQTLYMFHTIRYLRSIMLTYLIVLTLVFGIIQTYNRILRKKNEKVTEIYRYYVANVSHELKSPIASIRALTETLQEGLVENEEERSRCYGMIYREVRGLEHSVQDILELSRVQEHRIDFTCTEATAKDVFAPVFEKYASLCEDLDIRFEADASVYALPLLYTNADRIRQIAEILLNNAIKFMDEEREGRIRISADADARRAVVHVQDNGIGIAADDLPHVFERFYKSSTPQNRSGTGLGLAIAKEITAALDEEITVSSTLGEGTVFTFTIRLTGKKRQKQMP